MASYNKITIIGHLGRDPELRYTPQGTPVCDFSVATSEKRKDQAGEGNEITTWFRISVWGKLGELANQYLSKGRQVYIEGRLRQEDYTDRDGNKRTSLKVSATEVQFLGSRPDESAQSGSPGARVPAQSREGETGSVPQDDEVPF